MSDDVGSVAIDIKPDNEFSATNFKQSVLESSDLQEAVDELDKCVENKEEILKVYNGIGELYDSPLFLIVNTDAEPTKTDRGRLLTHPVMRRVVQMKWELFAKRIYLAQLVLNCILVLAMTLSAWMNYTSLENTNAQLKIWLYVVPLLLILLVSLRWYSFKGNGCWYFLTLVVLLTTYLLLRHYMDSIASSFDLAWFKGINNVLIALIALCFLAMEMSEFFASLDTSPKDMTFISNYPKLQVCFYYTILLPLVFVLAITLYPFFGEEYGENHFEYFDSAFNFFQIPTYTGVILYALNEFLPMFSDDTKLYLGILLTFMLWVLSLQYLEVHATAGYLLPMMRAITGDMVRFMTFYAPFQIAYTFAYFLLFQNQQPVPAAYNTIGSCFVTTFLVMLGNIDVGPFEDLSEKNGPYVLGYVILLTHATLVIVMLLNVIVAMMTKTMDGGLEKARVQAIISFAECVSRCEKVNGLHRITLDDLKIQNVNETSSLVKSQDNVKYDGSSETTVDEKTKDEKTTDEEEKNHGVFDIFTEFDKDWELELDDLSTDDRIDSLRDELSASIKKNEAKVQRVIDLLLEIKKIQ